MARKTELIELGTTLIKQVWDKCPEAPKGQLAAKQSQAVLQLQHICRIHLALDILSTLCRSTDLFALEHWPLHS